MQIIPLHQCEAIKEWAAIVEVLHPAMLFESGKYNLDDVREMIEKEMATAWVAIGHDGLYGALITQIVDYPKKSMLLILCMAGKSFHLWDNVVKDYLIPYAKQARCDGIEFLGRKGWVRRAAKLGFKPVHIVYELSLGDN